MPETPTGLSRTGDVSLMTLEPFHNPHPLRLGPVAPVRAERRPRTALGVVRALTTVCVLLGAAATLAGPTDLRRSPWSGHWVGDWEFDLSRAGAYQWPAEQTEGVWPRWLRLRLDARGRVSWFTPLGPIDFGNAEPTPDSWRPIRRDELATEREYWNWRWASAVRDEEPTETFLHISIWSTRRELVLLGSGQWPGLADSSCFLGIAADGPVLFHQIGKFLLFRELPLRRATEPQRAWQEAYQRTRR